MSKIVRVLVAALLVAGAFAAREVRGQNLLRNGDFAADLSGWVKGPGGSAVWSDGAALLTSPGQLQSVDLTQCVALPPGIRGVSFRLSARFEAGQSGTGFVHHVLILKDGPGCTGADLGADVVYTALDKGRQVLALAPSLPAAAVSAWVGFSLDGNEGPGAFQARVDDVSFAPTVTVTIPASASIAGRGGAFFKTELLLFDHSETSTALVAAVHRCFAGQTCPPDPLLPAGAVYAVSPRSPQRIPDVLRTLFGHPDTAGAIELSYDDTLPITATARTSAGASASAAPEARALFPTEAVRQAVLLGLAGGSAFRTNVGVYNPGDESIDVTLTPHCPDAAEVPFSRAFAPKEPYQLNDALGQLCPGTASSDAWVEVTATAPVFSYATIIENATARTSYVEGVTNRPPPSSNR
jgi:hypothetical protein